MYGNSESGYGGGFDFFARPLPQVVKALLWVNVAVFLATFAVWTLTDTNWISDVFALHPKAAVEGFRVWQFFTYAYVHSLDLPMHILFNMLMLWMFGGDLARYFGTRKFLALYHVGAFVGGIAHAIAAYARNTDDAVIGASGSIYALMAVFAFLWPNRVVLLFLMFPMRVKYLVLILVGVDLVSGMRFLGGGVAHWCHIGGAVGGYLFFRLHTRVEALFERIETRAAEREVERESEVRKTVDELLEKIRRDGIHTLSAKEKRFLTNASKLYKKEDPLP